MFLLIRCILGTQRYHIELEELVAEFLGVESCIAFGMVCKYCFQNKIFLFFLI